MTRKQRGPVLEHRTATTKGSDPLSDMETTTKPTLDALIRTALRMSDAMDREQLIDDAMDLIRPEEYGYYLRQAVSARFAANISSARAQATPRPIRSTLSTKQTLIRDQYWPAFLRQRVRVASIGLIALADATSAHLLEVAADRHAQAVDLTRRASEFERLADLMDKSGAVTLSDLEPSTGMTAIERAA